MSSFLKASSQAGQTEANPLNSLLIREKNEIKYFQGLHALENEDKCHMDASAIAGVRVLRIPPISDLAGKYLCVVPEQGNLMIFGGTPLEKTGELNIADAQKAEFSPSSSYLITWSMPVKGSSTESPTGNMRIWSTLTGEQLSSYYQKIFKNDIIQFTSDDELCFRQVTNEVRVYQTKTSLAPEATTAKLIHPGFTQFKISQRVNNKVSIAVFNPEAGGKPAKVTVYIMDTSTNVIEGPVNSRTIFGASEALLSWNTTGTALLIHSQSDVDSSNSSYYGAMGLYLIHTKSDLSVKVEQTKEGPVHAVSWSPTGDKFVIAAGNMPSQCTMYNEKGDPVFQFGAAHRNTVAWSPHGRFLCLAGFGNLAGEMDFWDTIRLKKLGSNVSHCATTYQWSPDSRYFLTATLAPRMNVDNGFKIFKYNGIGPVFQYNSERAFDCFWKPVPSVLYPDRPPSPIKRGGAGDANNNEGNTSKPAGPPPPKAAIPAAQPYRPPHSTGELSNFMSRDSAASAPVGKVKKEDSSKNVSNTSKFVPSAQKQRVIPGMAPQQQQQQQQQKKNPSNNAAAASSGKGPQTAATTTAAAAKPVVATVTKTDSKPQAPPASNAKPATTSTSTSGNSAPPLEAAMETAESKEKRVKAINKKLKQIQEIKDKMKSGSVLEPDQLKKLETEEGLLKELELLK